MKKVKLYRFEELPRFVQEKLFDEFVDDQVEYELEELWRLVRYGKLTEKQAWNKIGCSKRHAKRSPFSIQTIYYENNKDEVEQDALDALKAQLFTKDGQIVN